MSVDLSLLPDGGVGWLDASGQHADIVLSTRIRLARNIEGYAFTGRARDGERLRVLSQVREAVGAVSSLSEAVMYRLDELPPTRSEEHTSELQSLRHLVCRLLLEKKKYMNTAIQGVVSTVTVPLHEQLMPLCFVQQRQLRDVQLGMCSNTLQQLL